MKWGSLYRPQGTHPVKCIFRKMSWIKANLTINTEITLKLMNEMLRERKEIVTKENGNQTSAKTDKMTRTIGMEYMLVS